MLVGTGKRVRLSGWVSRLLSREQACPRTSDNLADLERLDTQVAYHDDFELYFAVGPNLAYLEVPRAQQDAHIQ